MSNKTLDLVRPGYSRVDRNAVFNTLAGYIDRIATFQGGRVGTYGILRSEIREQRLHVVFPAGEVLPGQVLQIAAAEQYAIQRGVVLQVEYAS